MYDFLFRAVKAKGGGEYVHTHARPQVRLSAPHAKGRNPSFASQQCLRERSLRVFQGITLVVKSFHVDLEWFP